MPSATRPSTPRTREGGELGLEEAAALALAVEHPDLAADSVRFRATGAVTPRPTGTATPRPASAVTPRPVGRRDAERREEWA